MRFTCPCDGIASCACRAHFAGHPYGRLCGCQRAPLSRFPPPPCDPFSSTARYAQVVACVSIRVVVRTHARIISNRLGRVGYYRFSISRLPSGFNAHRRRITCTAWGRSRGETWRCVTLGRPLVAAVCCSIAVLCGCELRACWLRSYRHSESLTLGAAERGRCSAMHH